MPAKEPGRALRFAAAELTRFADEDVEAILSELDVSSRRRLTELLDEYQRGDLSGSTVPGVAPGLRLDLASWLIERVSGGGEGRAWTMTPHASQMIARIAAEHGWTASPARSAPGDGTRGFLAKVGLR